MHRCCIQIMTSTLTKVCVCLTFLTPVCECMYSALLIHEFMSRLGLGTIETRHKSEVLLCRSSGQVCRVLLLMTGVASDVRYCQPYTGVFYVCRCCGGALRGHEK